MKKRYLFFLTILFTYFVAIPSSATPAIASFVCEIEEEKIPDNAIYIDLLLPISEDDEGYVSYHQENGEAYGIAEDSAIVGYCEEGYRSYTFHMADAQSQMRPIGTCAFKVSNDVYLSNKERFDFFADYCFSDAEDSFKYYDIRYEYKSEADEKLQGIYNDFKKSLRRYEKSLTTDYISHDASYSYDYCAEKYKYAKMAYLDDEGNIIEVSSKLKFDSSGILASGGYPKLSGSKLSATPQIGIPAIPAMIAGSLGLLRKYLWLVFVLVGIVALIVVAVRKKNIQKRR